MPLLMIEVHRRFKTIPARYYIFSGQVLWPISFSRYQSLAANISRRTIFRHFRFLVNEMIDHKVGKTENESEIGTNLDHGAFERYIIHDGQDSWK